MRSLGHSTGGVIVCSRVVFVTFKHSTLRRASPPFSEETMTKKEFVDEINRRAKQHDIKLTKKDTNKLLDLIFETAATVVEDEQRFSFPNFGTFKVKRRKKRKGVNPRTQEPMIIPSSKTVKFKPAPQMKERLN
jgi:DNA-binding protein HU-beta